MQQPFGWEFIDRKDASTSATMDFVLPTGYETYIVDLSGIVPDTDDEAFWMRISDDGGATYEADAGDYSYASRGQFDVEIAAASAADTKMIAAGVGAGRDVGSDAGEHLSGVVWIHQAQNASLFTVVTGMVTWCNGGQVGHNSFGAASDVAAVNNGIRFLYDTNNIESGVFTLFGLTIPSA